MTTVVVADSANRTLSELIVSHSLPSDTRDRVADCFELLAEFPEYGRALKGKWKGYRAILGPWRWFIIIYSFYDEADTVVISGFYDGRAFRASPTS